jgi:hypothetical protein
MSSSGVPREAEREAVIELIVLTWRGCLQEESLHFTSFRYSVHCPLC